MGLINKRDKNKNYNQFKGEKVANENIKPLFSEKEISLKTFAILQTK